MHHVIKIHTILVCNGRIINKKGVSFCLIIIHPRIIRQYEEI